MVIRVNGVQPDHRVIPEPRDQQGHRGRSVTRVLAVSAVPRESAERPDHRDHLEHKVVPVHEAL